jgi:hypothetical protein
MCRLTATALACGLAAVGVLRSHLWPLILLVLLCAVAGLLVPSSRSAEASPRATDLVRGAAMAAGLVLVLVGIGQLGLLGLLLGAAVLALALASARHREHHP